MTQRLQTGNEHSMKAQNSLLKKEIKNLQNILSTVPDLNNNVQRLQSHFNFVIQQNELLQRENQLLKNQVAALQYLEQLAQDGDDQASMDRELNELRAENQKLRNQIETLQQQQNVQNNDIDYFADNPGLDGELSKSVVMTTGQSKRDASDFKSTFGLSSQEENDLGVMGLNDV